jgi:phage terminase large subunit-like protein
MDSTVVTVVWVDWDRPDEFGYFDHRVLNWLELQGDDWEEQYFQIVNFLSNYDVLAVGVDANGVGDAVAQRLKLLLGRAEVVPLTSSPTEQSKRFKHLQALIQRQALSFPAHAKTRRLRVYKRFYQQMTDAEVQYKGANFMVAAPNETYAHDDFVDSLAIACSLTQELVMPEIEVSNSSFF